MLGLATNVLVRFLVQDDQAQFARAHKLIGRESRTGSGVLISLLVLLETEWVLRSRYSLAKSEILAAFSGLLASAELRFEDEHSVEEALFAWKASLPTLRIVQSAQGIVPWDAAQLLRSMSRPCHAWTWQFSPARPRHAPVALVYHGLEFRRVSFTARSSQGLRQRQGGKPSDNKA